MDRNVERRSAEAWRFGQEMATTDMAWLCCQTFGRGSAKLKYLVDLIGIEPMTSSMPWNDSNRK
jgi:hypothetical protein